MKKETRDFLIKRRINTSLPMIVRFKLKGKKDWRNFDARKGQYVIKWRDVLKAFRMEKYLGWRNDTITRNSR